MTMIKAGSTNVVRYFMMRKVTDGTAFTGGTITTFDLQYTRELTASAAKIDGIVGTGGAATHVDNKVFELDATSSPGLYMACFPDAAFAAGVDQVTLVLKYDATVFTEAQNIQLVAFDPFDTVRLGLTALPNAAAEAAGGLVTSAAGATGIDDLATPSNITSGTITTVSGNVTGSVGSLAAQAKLDVNAEADAAIETYNLDHLMAVADADDVVDNSVIAKLANSGATADWSLYVNTSDSLMAIRDWIGDGTNLAEAGGTGDQLTGITGVQLAADQAVNATKFGGATVTATTSVTIPASSTLATTAGAVGSVTGAVGSVTGDTKQTADVATLITTVGAAGVGLTEAGGDGDHLTAIPGSSDPWDVTLPGAYGAGKAGKIVGDNIDELISSRMPTTHLDATAGKLDGVALADTVTDVSNDVGITQTGADKVWTSAARTLTAFSTTLALSVWHVLESAIVTASTIGVKVKTNLDDTVASRMATTHIDATGGAVDNVTTVATTTTNTDMVAAAPTAAAVADQVWEEAIADHSGTGGSTAEALAAAGGAGDPWITALPGAYTSGQAGKILGDNLNDTISSRMATTHINATAGDVDIVTTVGTTTTNTDMRGTDNAALASEVTAARMSELDAGTGGKMANQVDLIKTGTDGIQTDLDNATDGLGALKTLIDAIQTDLDNGTDGLGALKTLIDAVQTDLDNGTDGLGALLTAIQAVPASVFTDAMTEAYSTKAGTLTLANFVYEVIAMLHEFTIVGTTITPLKRDGVTPAFTITVDDDTAPTLANRAT